MTATFYVGDAIEVMSKLPEKSVDLVLTSPPFLALRSYLPADHPDKALEGGSQATPGAFIDWLIDVVEACDRVLAPHGSLVFELGDTYSGSGGGGGDYLEGGWREGQAQFAGSAASMRESNAAHWRQKNSNAAAWPLAKSLSLIPELFRLTLVYGYNPLTGRTTERWRLRNVVRWVRPNPPVGALGDKFRPATSDLMVFCKSAKRYFDLDAVRLKEPVNPPHGTGPGGLPRGRIAGGDGARESRGEKRTNSGSNPAGAPPLDWWNIPLLEGEEETRYGPKGPQPRPEGQASGKGPKTLDPEANAGWAWERTLTNHPLGAPPLDWWNIPPGGYEGAHYAVFPPELCVKPIKAMCPEKVCRVCGEPSRRIVGEVEYTYGTGVHAGSVKPTSSLTGWEARTDGANRRNVQGVDNGNMVANRPTLGFSDCGHNDYRPGLVLDPFAGSGTTALVATGHGRDCILIDLDARNVSLARDRVGSLFFEVIDARSEIDRPDSPLLAEGGATK